mmetsp:Transcript_32039/g.28401  ORF Transcript_32039/g.28401 Transcript_32039/m.28401 type:complete len:140 (+) Transcript_32039:401-820(+)
MNFLNTRIEEFSISTRTNLLFKPSFIPKMVIKQAVIDGFLINNEDLMQIFQKFRHTEHILISNCSIYLKKFSLNKNLHYTMKKLSILQTEGKKSSNVVKIILTQLGKTNATKSLELVDITSIDSERKEFEDLLIENNFS